ncbi:MAG: zinc-dependent metalloprotease [Micrococcales bacterium]
MSEDNEFEDDGRLSPEDFQKFLGEFLNNPNSADAMKLAKAAGLSGDPAQLSQMLNQLRAAMSAAGSSPSGVNWDLAMQQAKQVARQNNHAIPDFQKDALREAVQIATLWLNQATSIAELTTEPKLLTRDLWIDDSLGLLKALSEPIALRMSGALGDHLEEQAPEELKAVLGQAGGLMKQAGAALFAMQLGGAMGKLSERVISGADLGLPIFTEQRAAFVPQNLEEFASGIGDKDQVLIYLAVRELAHARLFKEARWLRDHVVAQIVNYASQISVDGSQLADLAESIDESDPDRIREVFETHAFIAPKTEDQERALERIETMLALIEGWVEAVTESATGLLPKASAIAEAVRRRRAAGGPAELTFGTLLGLELRPRRLREATAMWREVGFAVGNERRDELWSHPDQLPSTQEILEPKLVINRLLGITDVNDDDGDDFDRALRDLLS